MCVCVCVCVCTYTFELACLSISNTMFFRVSVYTFTCFPEGVFGSVNSEKDRQEERERQKCQRAGVGMLVCMCQVCVYTCHACI